MKNNKCSLCGWVGKTHLHHIIPKSLNGSNHKSNIIELCPNHHSEANNNEPGFAKRYNLIGLKMDDKEIEELQHYSLTFMKYIWKDNTLNKEELLEALRIEDKFGYTSKDALAQAMGLTINSVEKYTGVGKGIKLKDYFIGPQL